MTWLYWIVGLGLGFVSASALALYSYGRFARRSRGAPSHALPVAEADTALDRLIAPLHAEHPGQTGVSLVLDNAEAFAQRVLSLRAAGRSLDVMTYIWRDDTGGRLIAAEVLAAADRGVRVRLLLDDVNTHGLDPKFVALDKHPGIEVRLFNPIRARRSTIGRGLEILLGLVRYNRRMHCKLWLADGRLAITGGRNIGTVYLARDPGPELRSPASRDADLLMLGALAEEAAEIFDRYWNSGIALPMRALWPRATVSLGRLRERLRREATGAQGAAMLAGLEGASILPDPARLHWTAGARLLADPPEKALGHGREHWLPQRLAEAMGSTRTSLRLVTPYFVPGREGLAALVALARRGVRVQIVTNALAATNHTVVHGAYRRYRRPLLAAGAAVHEFAPGGGGSGPGAPAGRPLSAPGLADSMAASVAGGPRPQEMLHAKLLVADAALCFVGSFNFDLRSAFLNTEMGVACTDPHLVAEVLAEIERLAAPEAAWRLHLDGRVLRWEGAVRGPALPVIRDPEASAVRRGTSWVIGHLPIHSQL